MPQILEVVAHPVGPWLVKAGNALYAVPPRLGRALRPLTGRTPECRELRTCLADVRAGQMDETCTPEIEAWVCELGRALALESAVKNGQTVGRRNGRKNERPIRLRVPLIPAPVARSLAGFLLVLAGNRGLAVMALLGGVGYVVAGYQVAGSSVAWAGSGQAGFSWEFGTAAAGLGLFLLTAVWHELGHAAALTRSGYPPGGIGAGVLFVIPVLFADVTAMGALPRAGRIRVDISGIIFQLAAGGVFMALAGWSKTAPGYASALTLAGSSALLAISWSLFPFIRSDGYWLLCDLLGLDDLDRPPSRPISKWLRVFLVGYQLANAAFLLMIGVYFPLKIIGLLFGLAHRIGVPLDSVAVKWLAPAAGLAFLGMMGVGIMRRVVALVRSARVVTRGHG